MSKRTQAAGFKLMIAQMFKDAHRQTKLENRVINHRIGSGRTSIFKTRCQSKDYGVGFCGGAQEIARRARGGNYGITGALPARG